MRKLKPHLLGGAKQSGELIEALQVSRAALKKAYEQEQDHVLRFGRARRTRYAARRTLPGLKTDTFPVFRVNESGSLFSAGELVTLAASESVWLPSDEIVAGLPPEMHDVAPQGFLGRSYAKQHAELALPVDVTKWSDNHILIALSRRGEDLPGNLIVGRESFERFHELHHDTRTVEDFQRLSEEAIAGEHVGSSAGGEQPKFTALIDGQHRIVKFATDATDNARRWQDLLVLEHIALQTLHDAGIESAAAELFNIGGLRCLMIDRFDRIGETGRRSVMTLSAAAQDITGSWTDAAQKMHRQRQLTDDGLQRIALLDAFGSLIANNDRHHYNICLYPTESGYEVAPAFDQLPMAYSPPASGNLINEAIRSPHPAANTFAVWDEARRLATEFWRRAADQQLSDSMRRIVKAHSER